MIYDDKTEPYPTVVQQYFSVYAKLVRLSRSNPEYAELEQQRLALWGSMSMSERRQVAVAEEAS